MQALLQFDYGGLQESAGKKVSVWSATVITKGRKQEHFDYFFNALNSKKADHDGAKKNGSTGVFFLHELFDPKRGPPAKAGETQKSAFRTRFPDTNELIFSGDTGNGYRAYMMLEEISTMFEKFGLKVELIPLSPGHAWNRTDARIAHMNTFLRSIKRASRIFGAEQVAQAFHLASDPSVARVRKFMARSHVMFRIVKLEWTPTQIEDFAKQKGAVVLDRRLHQGRMGVKGLLYFRFWFTNPDGSVFYPRGYASVREHGNPDEPGNPTYVYAWRKDLNRLMCQPCSNHAERPVMLAANACTKKLCSKEKERRAAAARTMSSLPSLPLLANEAAGDVGNDGGTDQLVPIAVQEVSDEQEDGEGEQEVEQAGGEWHEEADIDGEGTGVYYYNVDFDDCVPDSYAAILEEDANGQQSLSIKKVVRVCATDDEGQKTFMAKPYRCDKDTDTRACVKAQWFLPPSAKEELVRHFSVIALFKKLIAKGKKLGKPVTYTHTHPHNTPTHPPTHTDEGPDRKSRHKVAQIASHLRSTYVSCVGSAPLKQTSPKHLLQDHDYDLAT